MFSPRIDDDGGSNVSLRFGRLPYFGSSYQEIFVNILLDLSYVITLLVINEERHACTCCMHGIHACGVLLSVI